MEVNFQINTIFKIVIFYRYKGVNLRIYRARPILIASGTYMQRIQRRYQVVSGSLHWKINGRKEFHKLKGIVEPGDTIVFDSVSRMSRDADEGIWLYMEWFDKGINLVFLKERYINTDVYKTSIQQTIEATGNEIADIYIEATNKVIKLLAEQQIRKAFEQSEKEVRDLHERTREGIREAKRNGKQIGRSAGMKVTTKKSMVAKKLIQEYSKDFGGTLNDIDTMVQIRARVGTLSRNTYYKYKREMFEQWA